MKRIKTYLFVTLGILAVTLLAGCGNNSDSRLDISETTVETSVSEEKAFEETESSEKESLETESVEKTVENDLSFCETPNLDDAWDTVEFPEGMDLIQFSGNEKSVYISDNYGVYESEKYILLVDKNVELPGNYAMILDDIVNTIEEISGLSFATERKNFSKNMISTISGEMPWLGLKSGTKFIIQLNNSHRDPYSFPVPDFFVGYVCLQDRGLYTFPEQDHVEDADYQRMINVLSKAIFSQKYPNLAETDRADEVVSYLTIEKLEEKYPDFKRIVNTDKFSLFRPDVNSDNIEKVWISEHKKWSSWQEEEAMEELFIRFMLEEHRNDFPNSIVSDNYNDSELKRSEMAERMKSVYGEDIFVKYFEWVSKNLPDKPQPIELNGKGDSLVYTDNNCYVEGDKCFIYISEGLYIPNNFVEITDSIIEELERKMWGSGVSITYGESSASNNGIFYGISGNNKLPIELKNDTDGMGYISVYYGPEVCIYDIGMMENDINKIDYEAIAHECSHAVMDANGEIHKIGKIMTEGSASYYAGYVMKELNLPETYLQDYSFYELGLTSKTAEQLFLDDYKDVGHADRGAEYAYGFYFSEYLNEMYGDEFLSLISSEIEKSSISTQGSYGDDSDREKRLIAFKKVFGEDVFTKFGSWYENR